MAVQLPPNSTGSVVDTVQATTAKERQIVSNGDPNTGANVQAVLQRQSTDNQAASGYAAEVASTPLVQNAIGNTDRAIETGVEGAPALGIPASAPQLGLRFL